MLLATGRRALDLLLPPHCATCDAPVERHGQLCAACFRDLSFITEPCCAHCGLPFAHAAEAGPSGECAACLAHPPPWGRARAGLAYDGRARHLVLPFKYADRTELAAALVPPMLRAGAALLREAELLVPVPLHRRRLLSRRYNQAVLLARALARATGLTLLPDALIRSRATPRLASLGAAERARTVEGAFILRPARGPAIAGRRVLLVDDLLTSGATAAACAKVLLAAGAAGVDVLVAARVGHPRRS